MFPGTTGTRHIWCPVLEVALLYVSPSTSPPVSYVQAHWIPTRVCSVEHCHYLLSGEQQCTWGHTGDKVTDCMEVTGWVGLCSISYTKDWGCSWLCPFSQSAGKTRGNLYLKRKDRGGCHDAPCWYGQYLSYLSIVRRKQCLGISICIRTWTAYRPGLSLGLYILFSTGLIVWIYH